MPLHHSTVGQIKSVNGEWAMLQVNSTQDCIAAVTFAGKSNQGGSVFVPSLQLDRNQVRTCNVLIWVCL